MDVTFDFLISKSNRTLYSGHKSLGFTIEGKDPNYYDDIVVSWLDEHDKSMKEMIIQLPAGTFRESKKIQIRSDRIPTDTNMALKITVKNLVPDPNDYEHNWYVLSGGRPYEPGFDKDRYIQIQGPLDSRDKSTRPKPIESVMVHLEEGGNVEEPLVAGSNIFTHGKWFQLSPNSPGKNGESRGKYFLFLDR